MKCLYYFRSASFFPRIAEVERYDLATEIDAINRMMGKQREIAREEWDWVKDRIAKKIGSQWINSIDSNFDGSSELVKKRTAEAAYSKHTFLLSITRAHAPSLSVCHSPTDKYHRLVHRVKRLYANSV